MARNNEDLRAGLARTALEAFAERNGYTVVAGPYRASEPQYVMPYRITGGWWRALLKRDGEIYHYWFGGGRWKRA